MEINKILFEQLNNKNTFKTDDLSPADNIQSESVEPATSDLKEEISLSLNTEDDNSLLVIEGSKKTTNKSTNTIYSNTSGTNNLINTLSFQSQVYNNSIEDIEEEIKKNKEEYEKLAQELEKKQEEYNSLVSEAEDSNNESLINKINAIAEEINYLISDLESLETKITNLQKKSESKQEHAETLNIILDNLSVNQSNLNTEVDAVDTDMATNTANDTSLTDTVNKLGSIKQSTFQYKTQEEYNEILYSKFDELWEKFNGNIEEINSYVKENISEFTDIDGDGKVTKIDQKIFENSNIYEYTRDIVKQNKLPDKYVNKVYSYSNSIKDAISDNVKANPPYWNLDDLEAYSQFGGNYYFSQSTAIQCAAEWKDDIYNPPKDIDFISIAKSENFEERLKQLSWPNSAIKYVNKLANYIKTNPQNANYAQVAVRYQEVLEHNEAVRKKADEIDWAADADARLEKYHEILKTQKSDYKEQYKSEVSSWKAFSKRLKTPPPCPLSDFQSWFEVQAYERATGLKVGYGSDDDISCCGCSAILSSALKTKYLKENLINDVRTAARAFDVTGNGKVDVDDYFDFTAEEIDLDGDGVVSSQEKQYLAAAKNKIATSLGSKIRNAAYNGKNTIEDVIDYAKLDTAANIETQYTDSFDRSTQSHKDYFRNGFGLTFDETDFKEGMDPYKTTIVWRSRWLCLNANQRDYIFNRKHYTDEELAKILTVEKYDEIRKEVFDLSNPLSSYLQYVKTAKLSKEELQEILDKINAAPSSIQSKLSEIKEIVEQKLACL